VFGIIERGGRVYTQVIKRMDRRTLMPVIHMIVEGGSTIFTDEWRSFATLKKEGYKHHKINHFRGYAKKTKDANIHTNNIEGFWSFAKRRLAKFNGISRDTFPMHIKECEFRFNNRKDVLGAIRKAMAAEKRRIKKLAPKK